MIRENAALVRAVADALQERRHLGPGGFLELVDRFRTIGKEPSRG